MSVSRTARRAVLTAAVVCVSTLAVPSTAQAAPLPPACQEALLETLDKFPVVDFTVPDKVKNTMTAQVLGMSEADQAVFTEVACAAWNTWATQNGQAVATDLDSRYRNAAGPVCNKFARSALATIKKHSLMSRPRPGRWRGWPRRSGATPWRSWPRTPPTPTVVRPTTR